MCCTYAHIPCMTPCMMPCMQVQGCQVACRPPQAARHTPGVGCMRMRPCPAITDAGWLHACRRHGVGDRRHGHACIYGIGACCMVPSARMQLHLAPCSMHFPGTCKGVHHAHVHALREMPPHTSPPPHTHACLQVTDPPTRRIKTCKDSGLSKEVRCACMCLSKEVR